MKSILSLSLVLLTLATTQITYAQLTKLSNNTSLYGGLLNNAPIFISEANNTLWTTDGTASGTIQFTYKVNYDTTNYGSANILNGKLYFSGVDTANMKGLWVTDATDAGTVLVMSTGLAPDSAILTTIMVYNNTIFFFTYTPHTGLKLWKTDGTNAGTVLIKDINPSSQSTFDPDYGVGYYLSNGILFFTADDPMHGNELWKTDGTTGGTALVKDINPGSGDAFTYYGLDANADSLRNYLFFSADDGTGTEVWKTDGTSSGTTKVKDINPNPSGGDPYYFTTFNNKIYFLASDTSQHYKFWTTDGTDSGTVVLSDVISPDLYSSIIFGNHLVFTAYNRTDGYGLWATDGTPAGTLLLKAIDGYPSILEDYYHNSDHSHKSYAPPFNGKTFMEVKDIQGEVDLWITDGTTNGTYRLDTISSAYGIYQNWFYTQKNLYFTGPGNRNNDLELWKSDGTAAGTHLVKDINPGRKSSYPDFDFVYNDHLYLTADDGDNSNGLSDLYILDEQVTLPLSLLDFRAAAQPSKAVKLEWNTTNQTNVSSFEIERSTDGTHFTGIYKKNDVVNSTRQQYYQYLDQESAVLNAPVLFYRLKMADKDGSYSYSKILSVHFYNYTLQLSLSPNPVRNQLNVVVETKDAGNALLRVTDAAGKQVYIQKLPFSQGSIQKNILVAQWQNGIYYVQLITGNGTKTAKFMKE